MLELNKEEKAVLKKILSDTMEGCAVFRGEYDAKNGKEDFMYGVGSLLEYLAYSVSNHFGKKVENKFIKNMIKSEKKTLDK